MKKIFLSLLTIFMVLSLSVVLVKANETTTVAIADGVQIRTDGNNGLKWVANITNHKDTNEYGFLFAQGDLAEVTVNTANVVNKVVEGVTAEEPVMTATMVNFPKKAATQDISVVAYVKDGENYSYSNVVVRNLAEVAVYAKNTIDGEFVNAVVEEVSANYMNTYKLGDIVFVNNAVYETNPANLEKTFIADWNAKFGTEFAEYNYTTWANSAKAGYGEGAGMTANGDTDCSGTNAYEFFITDEATSAKWGWLLDFLLAHKGGTVHPNRQIQALRNGGSYSDSYGGGLQQFGHLSRSLQNFFDAEGKDVYGSGIDVILKDLTVYGELATYNTTVYAANQNFVEKGSELELAALSKDGYTFDGYKDGETAYNGTYEITEANVVLNPSYTAIKYDLIYMEGEVVYEAKTYTIEDYIELPVVERDGYEFLGWYDNPEFEGDPITIIEKGNTGAKTFYLNIEEKAATVVTFDTAGGYLAMYPSVDAAIADFLADYNTARNKSHTPETFYALGSWGEISDASLFLYNANYKAKWTWLVNYIAGVASSANKPAYTDFYNYTSQAELNAANSNHIYRVAYELRGWVGQAQYTKNGNFVTADYSTASVQAAYVAAVTLPNTYEYNDPCTLPTPIKENHTFLGWVDSEGNAVTEFPGQAVAGEAVTYTATWETNYANVTVTFDAGEGHLPMAYDPNAKAATIYDNVGGAAGTYLCDTSITPNNSLRWQYKVLLQYDETLDAYLVVCLDAAKASANNAASAAGVTWTHALANAGSNISTQYTVGQYIKFEGTPAVGDQNLSYVVCANAEAAAAYQYPTTYETIYENPVTLLVPVREGYTFEGWKSSVDGQIYTEFPGYLTNPGDITYTAQWVKTFNVSLSLDGGNLLYSTYEELIADYTADYKTLTGQGSFSVWKGTVNKLGDMFRNSNKWDWLLDYWAAVNTNSYNGTTNASVFAKMKENGTCSDYYFFSVEMTAFGTSTSTSVYSGGLKSADYTQEAVRNLAWTYLSQSHETTTEYTSEYVLPTIAYKAGYTFAGWYTTADFQEGTQVTSVSDDCTVYAKWVAVAE